MLNHERMVELYRELAERPVLSVYIDGSQHDPAGRNMWRTKLEHGLDDARRRMAGGEVAVEEYDAAVRFIQKAIEPFDGFVPGKSFVAFATPDKLWYAETVGISMPDIVRWDTGIAIAPYVRGLKQDRSVVIALLESQRARLFLYRDGEVQEMADLRADTFVGDLSDVGVSKRGMVRTGMRGETSTDAAHRTLEVASERMVKELVKEVVHRAGDHGFVVVGGVSEMTAWVRDALPKHLEGRVLIDPSLQVEMRQVEVRQGAGAAASELTKRWQLEEVAEVFNQARAGARGAMGYEETEQALAEMRVDIPLLSRARTRENPEDADRLIGLAFAGGAHVEEVSGAAADKLDTESEGIAARLRFRVRPQVGLSENGGGGSSEKATTGWTAGGDDRGGRLKLAGPGHRPIFGATGP